MKQRERIAFFSSVFTHFVHSCRLIYRVNEIRTLDIYAQQRKANSEWRLKLSAENRHENDREKKHTQIAVVS